MSRYRILRKNKAIRALVRETRLHKDELIQPFFVVEGSAKKEIISSMPGIERYSVDTLLKEIEKFIKLGGNAGLLFGLPKAKDNLAKAAYDENGVVQKAIRQIKKHFPEFLIITDVCLCAYMKHGHCGVLDGDQIDNDKSLPLLAKMAVSHAAAGADIVAPSDMMDYRVAAIREALDENNFKDTALLSYAVKYASAYYGPFRDAADSAPSSGDRKTYQMDSANVREALKEARQDVCEGADMVMVKPALAYLDIIKVLRQDLDVPIVAYNVSGEYSMVKAAAQKKWIDERAIVLENLTAMKRAGADIIISYHTQDVLSWLK
ncbi:MAG: porphobilinogen synthase [Candidatus Omnitrophica bacterium]|nr:porphobilinogen synthase [Candidatus Omnitrophota bacterium]